MRVRPSGRVLGGALSALALAGLCLCLLDAAFAQCVYQVCLRPRHYICIEYMYLTSLFSSTASAICMCALCYE